MSNKTKKILSLLAASTIAASMLPQAMAAKDDIKVVVDGTELALAAGDTQPFIEDGRTLVPMRAIFEALGATVEWDDKTKTVTSHDKSGKTDIELKVGSDVLKVNNESIKLDVPAKIVDGRTVVPVRAISESLNCTVAWAQDTRTVSITSAVEMADAKTEDKDVLEYWADDSKVKASIIDFVTKATDPSSDNYIPVEDRIVVSDMDGTLMGELCPTYFDYCLLLKRALYDDSYTAPDDMKEFALELQEGVRVGKMPEGVDIKHASYLMQAFKDMPVEEYKQYVRDFKNSAADGFEGLKRGFAFYKPMVSLVDYLQDNGFSVYVVSGADRTCARVLMEGNLNIPSERVIGSDTTFVAKNQGDKDGLNYLYSPDDELLMGGNLVVKDLKMNKVNAIQREIGKVPVLALGNSSGDLSMGQYVVNNSKYKGQAYMLLCDNLDEDYGNLDKAESFKKSCDDLGFTTVSMKNDFATIYGDDVKVTGTRTVTFE